MAREETSDPQDEVNWLHDFFGNFPDYPVLFLHVVILSLFLFLNGINANNLSLIYLCHENKLVLCYSCPRGLHAGNLQIIIMS